jgi:hypothetical protein
MLFAIDITPPLLLFSLYAILWYIIIFDTCHILLADVMIFSLPCHRALLFSMLALCHAISMPLLLLITLITLLHMTWGYYYYVIIMLLLRYFHFIIISWYFVYEPF